MIVDLTGCSFMDSTGLQLLVRTRGRFGRVAVASPNRTVLKILEVSGLDRLFAIYPSRTAALSGDGDR